VDLLLQTAGSLVAILALAGLAWWLKLGGGPLLDSAEVVQRAADEVEAGFTAIATAQDSRGLAALARDAAGRVMVIKRHGNRFAGRVLGAQARAEHDGTALAVDCGEARFGRVILDIPDPQAWAEAINRVNRPRDA
jgi:hypothetical protein